MINCSLTAIFLIAIAIIPFVFSAVILSDSIQQQSTNNETLNSTFPGNSTSSNDVIVTEKSIWKRSEEWLANNWRYFVFAGAFFLVLSCLLYGFSHRKLQRVPVVKQIVGNDDKDGPTACSSKSGYHGRDEIAMEEVDLNEESSSPATLSRNKAISTIARPHIKLPTLLLNRNLHSDSDLDTPGVSDPPGSVALPRAD